MSKQNHKNIKEALRSVPEITSVYYKKETPQGIRFYRMEIELRLPDLDFEHLDDEKRTKIDAFEIMETVVSNLDEETSDIWSITSENASEVKNIEKDLQRIQNEVKQELQKRDLLIKFFIEKIIVE